MSVYIQYIDCGLNLMMTLDTRISVAACRPFGNKSLPEFCEYIPMVSLFYFQLNHVSYK